MIPEGYKMQTTFFMDFNIADKFGKQAVIDTAEKSYDQYKDMVVYCKEMVFVLNIKCWQFHHEGNAEMSDLYSELYYKYNDLCLEHLKGNDLREYIDFLD